MDNNVVGREDEIKIFEKILVKEKSSFLAIYGRRRVGKTFLIRNYFKNYIQFSFTGSFEAETPVQLENFFREYLYRTNGKKETTPPKNWSTAFAYLADYLYSLKTGKKKIVVFIDELPWLDRPKSGFVPALEYLWNQHISKMNNVVLIVCGSAASWMQKKLLKTKGGLYNRITHRIRLMPFTLHETELFLKSKKIKLSKYQIVQIYMVMGGIPFYLEELEPGKSAEQLINDVCFKPDSMLADEYNHLYYSLFKNASNHMSIIEALASSPYGLNRKNLVKKSKLPEGGTFTRTLEDLYESGFVERYIPFNKKKKDTIYKLIDFYSLFYLKFIKNNISNKSNIWQSIAGQSSFKAWSGYAYENITMLHSKQVLKKLGITGIFSNISSWRHTGNDEIPGAQIDMLIDRKDGIINICEIKFSEKEFIINKKHVEILRRQRAIFQYVTKTRKNIVTTLVTTFPAIRNKYFLEEIHSEVILEDLFEK